MKVESVARLLERIVQFQMPVREPELKLLLAIIIKAAQDTWDELAPPTARVKAAEFLASKYFMEMCLTIGIDPEWLIKKIKNYKQTYDIVNPDITNNRSMRYTMSKAKPKQFTVIFMDKQAPGITYLYTTIARTPPQAVDNAWHTHTRTKKTSYLDQQTVSVLYVFNGRLRNRYKGHGHVIGKPV